MLFPAKIFSIGDTVDRKSLVEFFPVMILSRLDYCNLLYYGLPVYNIQKLQRIMNSACLFLGYHLVHQQQIISNSIICYSWNKVSYTKFYFLFTVWFTIRRKFPCVLAH